MKILLGLVIAAFVFALPEVAVGADTPLVIGYTNVSDCVAVFTAKEEGFFAKRGLDVELRPMQNSSIEATSIVAGALQAGCNAPPVLLAAVDRGVGLVAIAGASVSSPGDKDIAASDWTSKNPALLAAVRGALQEGTKFALSHQDKALQYVAQYTKQPMSVVQVVKYSNLDSNLTPKQMQWWIDAMKDQGLTHTAIVPGNAIAK